MIISSPEKHLTDQDFFTFVKFFEFIVEDKPIDDDEDAILFSLSDIGIGDDEEWAIFHKIFMTGQVAGVSVDISKSDSFDRKVEDAKAEIEKKPVKEKEKLLKIIKKIVQGKRLTLPEVADISWVWNEGIYHHIRFIPSTYKIPNEIKEMFRMEMNKYLDNFINNKLAVTKKNYFKFETQKNVLIKVIEEGKHIALYGNHFIIGEKVNKKSISQRIPDFCIIHTVYALQKLGYLKVVNVWEEKKYSEKSLVLADPTLFINVNLILEEAFIKEINNKYKTDNPKNTLEDFDDQKGVLKFAGETIELAKKGKETDAVLLMKSLLAVDSDDWKHNDEILAEWGYNEEDQKETPKNKVYHAGQKINNAVALKTKIDDFVECNTSKARINPKYRKVDE